MAQETVSGLDQITSVEAEAIKRTVRFCESISAILVRNRALYMQLAKLPESWAIRV